MRLQQLSPVKIDDAVFWVKMSWGRYRAIAKEQEGLPEDSDAMLDFMERIIREVVVKVDGLVGEDGQDAEWGPDTIDDLTAGQIVALARGIFSIGSDNSMDPMSGTSPA